MRVENFSITVNHEGKELIVECSKFQPADKVLIRAWMQLRKREEVIIFHETEEGSKFPINTPWRDDRRYNQLAKAVGEAIIKEKY